jgi:hypothetical protein
MTRPHCVAALYGVLNAYSRSGSGVYVPLLSVIHVSAPLLAGVFTSRRGSSMVTSGALTVEPVASAPTLAAPSHCAKIPPLTDVLTRPVVDEPTPPHVDDVVSGAHAAVLAHIVFVGVVFTEAGSSQT